MQQAAIVRSLLEDIARHSAGAVRPQLPLLGRNSVALCARSIGKPCPKNLLISPGDSLVSEEADWENVPLKLRRELVIANAEATLQPSPGVPGVEYAALDERIEAGAWYISFSRAVLSDDGQLALVYSQDYCGRLCASGRVHLLVRTPGGWKVQGEHLLWIS